MKISVKKLRDDCGSYYKIGDSYKTTSIFSDFENIKQSTFIENINFFYNLFFPSENKYYVQGYAEYISDRMFDFLNKDHNKKIIKKKEDILPFLENFVIKNFNEYMKKNKHIVENIVEKGRLDNLLQLFNFDKILKLNKIYKGEIKVLPNIKLFTDDNYNDDQIIDVPDDYLSLLKKVDISEDDGVNINIWKIKAGSYTIKKETRKLSSVYIEPGLGEKLQFSLRLNINIPEKHKILPYYIIPGDEKEYAIWHDIHTEKDLYFTTEKKAINYLSERKDEILKRINDIEYEKKALFESLENIEKLKNQ